jgi:hypothetical protein
MAAASRLKTCRLLYDWQLLEQQARSAVSLERMAKPSMENRVVSERSWQARLCQLPADGAFINGIS